MKKELTQLEMASQGGKARKKNLTPERRSEIARKAINARWKKYRAAKKGKTDEKE